MAAKRVITAELTAPETAPPHIHGRHIQTEMWRATFPFSGAALVFRAKRADRVKILVWEGSGLALYWKRLENGAFKWPPIVDGVMRPRERLSPAPAKPVPAQAGKRSQVPSMR